MNAESTNIFISYSHENDVWLTEFLDSRKMKKNPKYLLGFWQLSLREKNVTFWFDRKENEGIRGGDEWRELIFEKIDCADIAILLITQDFVISPFIRNEELPYILKRYKEGNLEILPILLEPARWRDIEFINSYQMTPGKPTPLSEYFEASENEWKQVRLEVLEAIENVIAKVERKRRKKLTLITKELETSVAEKKPVTPPQVQSLEKSVHKYWKTLVIPAGLALLALFIWFIVCNTVKDTDKTNNRGEEDTVLAERSHLSNVKEKNTGSGEINRTKGDSGNAELSPLAAANLNLGVAGSKIGNHSSLIIKPLNLSSDKSLKEIADRIISGNPGEAEKLLASLKKDRVSSLHNDDNIVMIETILKIIKNMVYIRSLKIYLDKYEVTVGDYSSFVSLYNKMNPQKKMSIPQLDDRNSGTNQPVHYLSCEDASRYASYFGKRLPTIAEWKYAAGLDPDDKYLYGKTDPYKYGNLKGSNGNDTWQETTSPIGSFKSNRYGIYDLIGNVQEWCSDPESNSSAYVVGGYWGTKPDDLLVEKLYLDQRFKSLKYYNIGFRCVFDPENIFR